MLKQLYSDLQRQDLSELIDALTISDLQKRFLRSRWLAHVLWMESQANTARNRYYILRLIAIVGGVIIPALVSLTIFDRTFLVIRWSTFGISLLVAVSIVLEEFFHFGNYWRHYRHTVESLKIEGWRFFQLSGHYQNYQSHADVYPFFAGRVEAILQQDLGEVYATEEVQEKKEEQEARKSFMKTNNTNILNKTDKIDLAGQNRIG